MHIVIPMAGRGQRFLDKGYPDPKPFIKLSDGKTLIEKVVGNIQYNPIQDKLIFLCLLEHKEYIHKILSVKFPEAVIILIDKITEGAACTVLLSKNIINSDEELVIINSDQYINDDLWFIRGINYFQNNEADVGIYCFWANNPKWSYCNISESGITEVVEKQVISNFATIGVYYFKQGKDFVRAAESMIKKNIRVNNEFYIAPSINQLIVEGKKILPFLVNDMWGLGTPEDLEKYERS